MTLLLWVIQKFIWVSILVQIGFSMERLPKVISQKVNKISNILKANIIGFCVAALNSFLPITFNYRFLLIKKKIKKRHCSFQKLKDLYQSKNLNFVWKFIFIKFFFLKKRLSKEIVLPSNNPQFEHAWEEYFFLQCLQNSHIMIKIKVLDLVSGKIFLLTIDVECEAFTWNSSLKNWSHLAMFVPSFFLANWQLIHFFGLIKNNKCNLFVRKTRKCSKLREIIRFIWNKVEYFGEDYLLLLILGLIVTISQSLDSEIRNRPLVSDSNDFGHLNFGILFLGMSILGMFLKIVFQNKVIAFPIPTVLLIIGIAMQHHEQHSIIGNIIHQTFGLAAFGTGIAKSK